MSKRETVRVKTNESRLIANLGLVFSNAEKVISELMQNARRAKSTEVHFSLVENTLIVEDNGIGVTDLQNLLTIAESGWDSETEAAESPFGMGFFAAIFSAVKVKVESRGKMIIFETAAAISLQEIEVHSTDYIGATRISLSGFKLSEPATSTAVRNFAKGFGIRVFFNGDEVERPHAIGQINTVDSDVGQICVSGIDCDGQPSAKYASLYFQGLPIEINKRQHFGNTNNVIHLNNTFATRMPDRDCLIDASAQLARIYKAIHDRWEVHLTEIKKTATSEQFITKFSAMRVFDLTHLLNDVPLLPAELFRRLDFMPDQTSDGARFCPTPVSQQEIESGEVGVCNYVNNNLDENDNFTGKAFAALMFIYRQNWLMLMDDAILHPEHWINKHVRAINGEDIQVKYTPIKEVTYSLNTCEGQAVLVDSFTITVGDQSVEIENESVALATGEYENTIIIPKHDNGAGALSQVTNWLGECDMYEEDKKDEDERLMANFIAEVRGETATETIRKALHAEGIGYKTNCIEAAVVVSINGAYKIQCDNLVDVLAKFGDMLVERLQKGGLAAQESVILDSAEIFAKKMMEPEK